MKVYGGGGRAAAYSFFPRLLALSILLLGIQSANAQATSAWVRSMGPLSGRIEGSVQQMTASDVLLKDGSVITGNLYVPGVPSVTQKGTSPNYGGIQAGTGASTPTNFSVTVSGNVTLARLVTRTDPVQMPTVAAPPSPVGTRSVTITAAGQSPGSFATLADLTLNSGVGFIDVPAGTYGDFSASSGSGFNFGTVGATQPSIYNLDQLTLRSGSELRVVGPIILTVRRGFTLIGTLGNSAHPEWLQLRIFEDGLNINNGAAAYANVTATGARSNVTLDGPLSGGVVCGQLTVNAAGTLRILSANLLPTVAITDPAPGATFTAPASITIKAAAADADGTIARVEFFQGLTKLGETAVTPYNFAWTNVPIGTYQLSAKATDNRGGTTTSDPVTVNVTRAPNIAPAISLTLPEPNALRTSPATINLSATATDSDGSVAKVEFLENGEVVGTLTAPTTAPSTFTSTDGPLVRPGTYIYTARATDNEGASTTSTPISLRLLAGIPYTADFETSEGYSVGALDGQLGWKTEQGAAQVTPLDASHGTQSVGLSTGPTAAQVKQEFGALATNPPVVFVDVMLKPFAGNSATDGTLFDLDVAQVVFVKNGTVGTFQLLNGNGSGGGAWLNTPTSVALATDGTATNWARVSVRIDFVGRRWDFYLDGKLIAHDLAFRSSSTRLLWLALRGSATTASRLDDVYVGTDNPLFEDADHDGMDDAWERLYGLDPTKDDRLLDKDGDGVSNIDEYIAGTNPATPPPPPAPDSDGDGLTDAQEDLLGTNKFFPDNPDVELQVFEPALRAN